MKILPSSVRRPDPVLFVILALLCAAVPVVYLQHRALAELDRQTALIIEKISQQTADEIAADIREALEGPVLDTLRAVNHPELREGRFDLVLSTYEDSLLKYPHVERFFLWSDITEARFPGEVLFFSGTPPADADGSAVDPRERGPGLPEPTSGSPEAILWDAVWRDPPLGRFIFRETRAYASAQRIYTALEYRDGNRTYEILVRQFWVDAVRDRYFALLGFVVNVEKAGPRLLPGLFRRQLARQLESGSAGPRLELEVLDDENRVLFGSTDQPLTAGAEISVLAQSLPPSLQNRTATQVRPQSWSVRVGPVSTGAPAVLSPTRSQTLWLSTLSVLFILVALAFAVRGQKRASHLARMQTEFASHVSHQLKTPLSLLTTVTETLALDRVRSPEKLSQYVEILRSETAHLSTLVDRILEFSRVDGGGRRYELEAVAIEALVGETVEAFRCRPTAEGADIRVEIAASPVVAADPAAIEQVLVNLLDNAIKYCGGAREVLVRVDRKGGDAIIEVVDHGIGIDEADRKRIFERFYRGAAAARDRRGFGLGLAIVKEIITAHRGRIDVASVPGRGSRFRVLLPMLHADPARHRGARSDLAARQAP